MVHLAKSCLGVKMDNNKLIVKNAEDSQKAFENAKSKGLDKPQDYMYMHSQNGRDYFKNIMFRNYISYAF